MQQAPPPEAPFADKMAYYRTQHTSKGVRATHLIGTPIIAAGVPLLFAKPSVGATMFVGGWAMQILGHRVFEKNLPVDAQGLDHLSTDRRDSCLRAVRRHARAAQPSASRPRGEIA